MGHRSLSLTGDANMNEPTKSGNLPSAEGIISRPSPFSVEETLKRLQEVMHSRNLTVFAQIDHSDEARKVGLTMQEAHVLIFGNPKGGTPLMVASPLLALDLPLKILVWQSEEQQVLVSSNSVTYLKDRYAIPQELIGNIAVIDIVIEQALKG
jgi:uncharacterized protein (DUF302 family)